MTGTFLERLRPNDWETGQRNTDSIQRHLRPAMPQAFVRGAASVSIPSGGGTVHVLPWTTEVYDSGDLWDGSSAFVVKIPGLYYVWAGMLWPANNVGIRDMAIQVTNPGTNLVVFQRIGSPGASALPQFVSGIYQAVAGHKFEVVVQQTTGAAINVQLNASYTGFKIVRLGGYTHGGIA